ncbi:hypothetical protein HanIR_Chr08g0381371 [Helianthus annuus]|nr:hypothetical protein HanIR_Chr08g0381371 [Helianthus annuus]
MFIFISFKLRIFIPPLSSNTHTPLFLRVEGLGVPTSHNNNSLADSQVESLQNREYTRNPLFMFTTFEV